MTDKSATPLCDAAEYEALSVGPYDGMGSSVVNADFARTLERRVAALEAELRNALAVGQIVGDSKKCIGALLKEAK